MRSNATTYVLATLLAVGAVAGISTLNRPAQATTQPDPQRLIAVVDVVALLEAQLMSAEFNDVRIASDEGFTARATPVRDELVALQGELQAMAQTDPAFMDKANRFQILQGQLQSLGEEYTAASDTLAAEQASDAYYRIAAATDVVAEREGYEYVIANRDLEVLGQMPGLPAVTQNLLARPLLRGGEDNDLTDAVRAELGLPEPGTEPIAEDVPAAEPEAATDAQAEPVDAAPADSDPAGGG